MPPIWIYALYLFIGAGAIGALDWTAEERKKLAVEVIDSGDDDDHDSDNDDHDDDGGDDDDDGDDHDDDGDDDDVHDDGDGLVEDILMMMMMTCRTDLHIYIKIFIYHASSLSLSLSPGDDDSHLTTAALLVVMLQSCWKTMFALSLSIH